MAADVPWPEPYPDVMLEADADSDPAARLGAKEATRLAFVATVQLLPPEQRAVLLLRDVLAWRADEVAVALDTMVAAVNSALQRARARMAEYRAWEKSTPEVQSVVEEWMRCWERLISRVWWRCSPRRRTGDADRLSALPAVVYRYLIDPSR